jgi:hypothetical protein
VSITQEGAGSAAIASMASGKRSTRRSLAKKCQRQISLISVFGLFASY